MGQSALADNGIVYETSKPNIVWWQFFFEIYLPWKLLLIGQRICHYLIERIMVFAPFGQARVQKD